MDITSVEEDPVFILESLPNHSGEYSVTVDLNGHSMDLGSHTIHIRSKTNDSVILHFKNSVADTVSVIKSDAADGTIRFDTGCSSNTRVHLGYSQDDGGPGAVAVVNDGGPALYGAGGIGRVECLAKAVYLRGKNSAVSGLRRLAFSNYNKLTTFEKTSGSEKLITTADGIWFGVWSGYRLIGPDSGLISETEVDGRMVVKEVGDCNAAALTKQTNARLISYEDGVSGEAIGVPFPVPVSGDSYTIPDENAYKPERTGYEFLGWKAGDTDTVLKPGETVTEVAGNVVLTAQWEAIPYTVTVEKGEGIKSVTGEGTYYYGDPVNLTSTLLDGYSSAAWTGDMESGSFTMPAKNVTLKVTGVKNQYSVTFDSDGGSSIAAQSVAFGEKAVKPADPTKTGYTFKEWQLNGASYDFGKAVSENLTLKAVWEVESKPEQNLEVQVSAITEVPETIREKYETVSQMEEAILKVLKVELSDTGSTEKKNEKGQVVKTKLMNLTAYVMENGRKRAVTKEDFPAEGLDVLVPYPEGSNASNDFQIAHVFETDMNGFKAGDIETPAAVKNSEGLKVRVKGLSPFLVAWTEGSAEEAKPDGKSIFEDVQDQNKWYYKPVYWAVDKGVTNGVDKTHFGPDQSCTRAQAMTFLYKVKDMTRFPEDGLYEGSVANKFADVPEGTWYTDPVNWAVSQGVTAGTGKNTFGPKDPCTRAQIVTFLWRAAGSPEPASATSFADVSADKWYTKAISWALEKKVTSGIGSGKFGPDNSCTRAQIMTFLWRVYH